VGHQPIRRRSRILPVPTRRIPLDIEVSSKSAEFMKFTVGLLDMSTVFMKDALFKTGGTSKTGKVEVEENQEENVPLAPEVDMNLHAPEHSNGGINEVSPSVGYSTESIGLSEQEIDPSINNVMGQENLPQWTDFANHVNFTSGDIQDWGLDQLYNFETFSDINPAIPGRPFVQEYDERRNHFAGF
jgi:hypothetical protein